MRNKILLTLTLSLIFCNLFSQIYFEDEVIYNSEDYTYYSKNTMLPISGILVSYHENMEISWWKELDNGTPDGFQVGFNENGFRKSLDIVYTDPSRAWYTVNSSGFNWSDLSGELSSSLVILDMFPNGTKLTFIRQDWHINGVLKYEYIICCGPRFIKSEREYSKSGGLINSLPFVEGIHYGSEGKLYECNHLEEMLSDGGYHKDLNGLYQLRDDRIEDLIHLTDSIRENIIK